MDEPCAIDSLQASLFGGLGAMAAGSFLFLDDAADFGRFEHDPGESRTWMGMDFSWAPEWVHHWWIGLLVFLCGVLMMLWSAFVLIIGIADGIMSTLPA